jgi:hypothetical protein
LLTPSEFLEKQTDPEKKKRLIEYLNNDVYAFIKEALQFDKSLKNRFLLRLGELFVEVL